MTRTTSALTALLLLAGVAAAGSETPPAGPPWVRDLATAQEKAIREGKPIFVYLTKTH
jgi:hypothetical protein